MYAVIETGGKQYRVQEGDVISVEKLNVSAGDKVVFDKVLVLNDGKTVLVGAPVVDAAKVEGSVIENGKGQKVIIFKYKSKKDYRKKQGHRQPYTKIQIEGLTVDGKKLKSDQPTAAKAQKAKAEKAETTAPEEKAEKSAKKTTKTAEAKEAKSTEEKAKKPAAKKTAKSAAEKAAAAKPAAKKAEKKPAEKEVTAEKETSVEGKAE